MSHVLSPSHPHPELSCRSVGSTAIHPELVFPTTFDDFEHNKNFEAKRTENQTKQLDVGRQKEI
eukprot:4869825-Amphidinium_carterae.2